MPPSVVILSGDPDLFENVRATLRSDGRFIDAGGHVHCDGSGAPLTNIFPVAMEPDEWDSWDPSDNEMPDPRTLSHLILECRSAEWVAEVGSLLAERLPEPVWIVDSGDKVWPAGQIDATRVVLA